MKDKYLYLAAVCVITHAVRTVYEILKHKKIITPGRTSFIIIFANMTVLWVSWFLMCSADISAFAIPRPVRYLGLGISVLGLVFFLSGIFAFKTLKANKGDLVTTGIYSKIRHPMYLGFILWIAGFPVYSGAEYSMLLAVPFIINVLYWRHLEERELLARFYDYTEYRRRTWF